MTLLGGTAAGWPLGARAQQPVKGPRIGIIDSGPVRRAVLAGCTQLRADLAAVPAGLGVPDRAEAENRAVERLVARVRALGHDALAHDVPVEQWLGDWEQIVAARRQAVREGKRFSVPLAHGAPVNIRMFELVRSGCR